MNGLRRSLPIFAILVAMAIIAPVAVGQAFGEPSSSFGSSSEERVFETPNAEGDQNQAGSSYFLHDQLTKLLVVVGLSILALVIVATRRFQLRRWLLATSVIALGFVIGGVLCPISAVQNAILKASTGYLLLFLVPTVTALFAGRLFCGYVCPFGALQELLHVRKLQRTIPERWMRILRFIPYAILVFLVVRVAATGILTWNGLTPFKAFFTFGGTPLTLGISGLFVVLSIFLFRPFCRLFCPLGAWLSLVSRLSPIQVRVGSSCVSCGKCDDACSSCAVECGEVSSAACLLCGECIRACPVGTLGVSGRHRRREPSSHPAEQDGGA